MNYASRHNIIIYDNICNPDYMLPSRMVELCYMYSVDNTAKLHEYTIREFFIR